MDIRNKRIVVVGLGSSGIDVCLYLHRKGAILSGTDAGKRSSLGERIRLLDESFIETEFEGHTEGFIEGADLLVVSPGIPKDALPIRLAMDNNIPVISEMELGYQLCKGRILAVTGTNGKSTVVTLLGEIFKKAGRDVIVCGNIGNSLTGELDKITEKTIVVLEVSSFQLEWIMDFKPAVSCILNITPDHLERYKDFNDYADAKFRIFENQTGNDLTVLNYDDPPIRNSTKTINCRRAFYSTKEPVEGMFSRDLREIYTKNMGDAEFAFTMPDCDLKGSHNIENVMAASLMAMSQGVGIETIVETLKGYKLLKHRLERVGEVRGVLFIDDSKATNIDATKRALEAMDRPVVLIAGGRDKGGDYRIITDDIKKKVKKMILIGEAAPKIEAAYNGVISMESAGTMDEATEKAFGAAADGDVVLLSPMCSSFDMFKSYKHRGEVFSCAVKNLARPADAGN